MCDIAVKNHSEIALVGSAGLTVEHLSSPFGGGVVLIHDGNEWDNTKGFFIERPADGGKPLITSAQYLPNGNLAIAGSTDGGSVDFGGIAFTSFGSNDMFRGEITPQGVGIQAIQAGSQNSDDDHLQITHGSGAFMVTGLYGRNMEFRNADGSFADSLEVHPAGSSRDQVYFAFYNASGTLQNVHYAYSPSNEDLKNVDLECSNDAFYAMIYNGNGGSITTSEGVSHDRVGPVYLKFDTSGNIVWSKQHEGAGMNQYGLGEDLIVSDEGFVTICNGEGGTCDLDFNDGVVNLNGPAIFWAKYDDRTPVAPTAGFTGSPLNIVQGGTVNFSDTSVAGTSAITSWNWSFGDGGTSSLQNPSHQYLSSGLFNVRLIVSDGTLADTLFVSDYVNVDVQSFDISPVSVTVPFDAESTQFEISSNGPWTIQDNSSWLTPSTTSGNGNANVSVSIVNKSKSSRTDSLKITATYSGEEIWFVVTQEFATLGGSASASPTEISVGAEVQLGAQGTGGTGTYSYSWTSDPVGFTSSEQSPLASPTETTTYYCTINDGTDAFSVDVRILVHPLPIVDFYSDSIEADSGSVVNFTADIDYSGPFAVTQYKWDFHDPDGANGGISYDENPAYTFHLVAVHDVSLTLTLEDGTEVTELKEQYITIKTGIDDFGFIPTETKLHQNYPNPFNPVTNLRIDIARGTEVASFGVYNIKGELVLPLEISSGTQKINLSQCHSGVYFARLVTRNGEVYTQKMLLAK